MSKRELFLDQLDALEKAGDSTLLQGDFTNQQVSMSLYAHGRKVGIRFSYTPTQDGFLVTYAENRKGFEKIGIAEREAKARSEAPTQATHFFLTRYSVHYFYIKDDVIFIRFSNDGKTWHRTKKYKLEDLQVI